MASIHVQNDSYLQITQIYVYPTPLRAYFPCKMLPSSDTNSHTSAIGMQSEVDLDLGLWEHDAC